MTQLGAECRRACTLLCAVDQQPPVPPCPLLTDLMPTSSCRFELVCVRILAAATRSTMRLCMLSLRRIALQGTAQDSSWHGRAAQGGSCCQQ